MQRCLVLDSPTTRSQQLFWAKYAHNTLPCFATGISPFEASLSYQPPLISEQERVKCPFCPASSLSLQAHMEMCSCCLIKMFRMLSTAGLLCGSYLPAGSLGAGFQTEVKVWVDNPNPRNLAGVRVWADDPNSRNQTGWVVRSDRPNFKNQPG